MKIDFYEEFPAKENLEKLKLVKFSCRLFLAAHSIQKFLEFKKQVSRINKNIQCAYWPIVKNSYWISPFSNKKDIKSLFNELDKTEFHLLIDLEPPLLNKKLFLKNSPFFLANKKIIKTFMEKNRKRITTAQFPISNVSMLMKIFGLDYNLKTEKSLMWYSSMLSPRINERIKRQLLKIKNKNDYSVSLGTIATGILGNEPKLSAKSLEKDLVFVKKAGFKKVVIFRLGGIDNSYMKVIRKFI